MPLRKPTWPGQREVSGGGGGPGPARRRWPWSGLAREKSVQSERHQRQRWQPRPGQREVSGSDGGPGLARGIPAQLEESQCRRPQPGRREPWPDPAREKSAEAVVAALAGPAWPCLAPQPGTQLERSQQWRQRPQPGQREVSIVSSSDSGSSPARGKSM
ncbi:hypothetical protein P7K49_000978 [Saguinus oedipus]|uniref:Uncharacterized protein n=1 Tax=Saguinus oedipus TaxID=9490 RepID=A0ABQ9WD83_SAGOE|nr:hypothetical protein P7K49_000978 [Saguinus oedipus]